MSLLIYAVPIPLKYPLSQLLITRISLTFPAPYNFFPMS
jgi:hypothetical protein